MRLLIKREYFLIFFTSSTLYALCGGLGASRGDGVVGGVTLALSSGFDSGGEG